MNIEKRNPCCTNLEGLTTECVCFFVFVNVEDYYTVEYGSGNITLPYISNTFNHSTCF